MFTAGWELYEAIWLFVFVTALIATFFAAIFVDAEVYEDPTFRDAMAWVVICAALLPLTLVLAGFFAFLVVARVVYVLLVMRAVRKTRDLIKKQRDRKKRRLAESRRGDGHE